MQQNDDDDVVTTMSDDAIEQTRKAANLADKEHLKRINLDRFLYSCYEQEVLRKVGEKVQKPLWYGAEGGGVIGTIKDSAIEESIDAMIRFYVESHKNISSEAASPENLTIFSDMAVSLVADVQALYFCKYQEHVPISTKLEKMRHTFWRTLRQSLLNHFPLVGEFIYSYLTWCYGMDDSQAVNADSLPPVGAFAPPPRAKINTRGELKLADRGRGGARGPDTRDRGNSRSGGGDRSRGGPPGRGDQNRFDGPNRGARLGPKRQRDRNFDRGLPEREKREADALRAVVDAIGLLKNDEGLTFVSLKPTNSFLRRMQHQEASTHGYYSYSEGEGKGRTVVVTRTPVTDSGDNADEE